MQRLLKGNFLEQKLAGSIIGSRETVQQKLEKFVEETQTDEIIINSQIFDHQARLHSYEIVADVIRNTKNINKVSMS